MRLVKVVGRMAGRHAGASGFAEARTWTPGRARAPASSGSRRTRPGKPRAHRPGRRCPGKAGAPAPSWWTARATAGEVTGGFTKEEILRRPEADPRAEGGMFARIEGLLRALVVSRRREAGDR